MSEPESGLRGLPSVDALLRSEAGQGLLQQHSTEFVAATARALIQSWRDALRGGTLPVEQLPQRLARAGEELRQAAELALRPSLEPVINATGVVVHTNLGRAPWPERVARSAFGAARGYSNLEFDLIAGSRGNREAHLGGAVRLFGCEASLVVNNCAAALLLALDSLAAGRETIVSRGELVEIGGAFRIPDIMAKSSSILREVGTTNRTRLADYEQAMGPATALLLKVHPSNFRVVGYHEEAGIAELSQLARRHSIPLIEDLGSGDVLDLERVGLPHEQTVSGSLAAGADLVLFSGDKLLGGPQAGIILGRANLVARLKSNPLYRALRPDKVTIAALEETFAIYNSGDPWREIPVLAALARSRADLLPRIEQLADALRAAGYVAEVEEGSSTVGGGAAPLSALPSPLVALRHPRMSADAMAQALRRQRPPVVARVEDERLLIDLRTVPPETEPHLRNALLAILA